MASYFTSGTSGSTEDNDDDLQPPDKRVKIEAPDPESNPESNQDVPGIIQIYQPGSINVARVERLHLKCPACWDYPRLEVYQCDAGHIICNVCITKTPRCPICNAKFRKNKIRNRIAEEELNQMEYECTFTEHGCVKTNLLRSNRTAHELQCAHNPSTTPVRFCSLFEGTRACQFRICPDSIMTDPQHSKDVIGHLTGVPHNVPLQKVKIGDTVALQFRLPARSQPPFTPVRLYEVSNGTRKIGLYALILRNAVPQRENLSWSVVGLNSAPENPTGIRSRGGGKVTSKFSIKMKNDPAKVATDGDGYAPPNQCWTVISAYLKDWKEFMMIPNEHRPLPSFSLPLLFLRDFYVQQDGKVDMSVRFDQIVN